MSVPSEETSNQETIAVPDEVPAVASGSIWTAARFPAQKCTAHKGDGSPCRAWAITGGSVCVYHGGKAKQVREAARKRLESLVPEALEVLADLAQGSAKNPATGDHVDVPPAVRARAAADILSRAGFAARTEHEVTLAEGPPRPDLDAAIGRALDARAMLSPGPLAHEESGGAEREAP